MILTSNRIQFEEDRDAGLVMVGGPSSREDDLLLTAKFDFQPFASDVKAVAALRSLIWGKREVPRRRIGRLVGSLGLNGTKRAGFAALSKLVGPAYAWRVAALVASGPEDRQAYWEVWSAAVTIGTADGGDPTAGRVALDLWGAARQGVNLPEWFLDLAGRV